MDWKKFFIFKIWWQWIQISQITRNLCNEGRSKNNTYSFLSIIWNNKEKQMKLRGDTVSERSNATYSAISSEVTGIVKHGREIEFSCDVVHFHRNLGGDQVPCCTQSESSQNSHIVRENTSPDFAPSNSQLFPTLKSHLGRRHSTQDAEVHAAINDFFTQWGSKWHYNGHVKLMQCY